MSSGVISQVVTKSKHALKPSNGSCYKSYLEGHPACMKCKQSSLCKDATIKKNRDTPPPRPGQEPEPLTPAPDPKEYLLKTLNGKFKMEATRHNDLKVWKFHDDAGNPAMMVTEDGQGEMRLCVPNKDVMVVDGFSSIDDVEKVLEALL